LRVRTVVVVCVCALLGALAFAWMKWRGPASRSDSKETSGTIVEKQPVRFVNRTFDPANPPPDMPPMTPGEAAVCDSNFVAAANVSGNMHAKDATHADVTVTRVKITLQLNITVWTPAEVSPRVMEHENGHRQISEHFYETADKVAEQIGAMYLDRQIEVSGADLNAETGKQLHQMAAEITAEYGKELNPDPAQELYDTITDHSRNDVSVQDAVTHAINNAAVEAN
jgi:hypothetical protein